MLCFKRPIRKTFWELVLLPSYGDLSFNVDFVNFSYFINLCLMATIGIEPGTFLLLRMRDILSIPVRSVQCIA